MLTLIAHKADDGREQPLDKHLQNVSRLAAEYAEPIGGQAIARRAGLAHDTGKCTDGFQRYIRDPEHNIKCPHSIIGAAACAKAGDLVSALVAEGHHTGLHDMWDAKNSIDTALIKRTNDVRKAEKMYPVQGCTINDIPIHARTLKNMGLYSFVRMEYSCLVDADYIDTETFMRGTEQRLYAYDTMQTIYDKLCHYVEPWITAANELSRKPFNSLSKEQQINLMRTEMLQQCFDAGAKSAKGDIRLLSIPTGGAKTISSFAYAAAAAKADTEVSRIIVVTPYTSITSQTASVLRDIAGKGKARRGRVDILQECDKSKVVNVWQLSVPEKGCSASSFTQTTVGEVLANCIKHYEDMEINRSEACKNADGTRRDFARPDSIILALSAMNKDNSIVPINNQMWMQLNNCVYNGGKYPSQLLSMIYERICKDALKAPAGTMYIIPPTLAGAIKAILIRNYKEDITVSLNPNNMSPAYVTGRIFALLVSGQHAIVPENQSQYDKRFLSRVVTNPVKVMPTIQMNFMQLKNRAQKSNRMGTYNAINNQIMDLIDMLDGNYPGRLTQVQRGEFFIGYNQQMHYNRDAAIAKKREKEENTIAMSAVNTVDETTVA